VKFFELFDKYRMTPHKIHVTFKLTGRCRREVQYIAAIGKGRLSE
jgi:hypothetical protein